MGSTGYGPDTTCLVVFHRQAALQKADQIILLVDGKLETAGTLKELLATCGEMAYLIGDGGAE